MVWLRFYGQLNDFLPAQWRYGRFARPLHVPASVKDAIESVGVPHPEVDVIIVNGEAVEFTYRVRAGDQIAVYPVFRRMDVDGLRRVGSDTPRPVRFAADIHLRKLASLLRLAGFDTVLLADDAEVAAVAANDGRVALTRDVGLLKRSIIRFGRWIRNTDPEKQLVEVLDRFGLVDEMHPFTRCMECNTLLVAEPAAAVEDRLPPGARGTFSHFRRCPGCNRIYWQGSHYTRLVELLGRARGRVERR